MAEIGYEIAANVFMATAIVVTKCNCGCDHITVHLLDEQDRVCAVGTLNSGVFEQMIKDATLAAPAHVGRPH